MEVSNVVHSLGGCEDSNNKRRLSHCSSNNKNNSKESSSIHTTPPPTTATRRCLPALVVRVDRAGATVVIRTVQGVLVEAALAIVNCGAPRGSRKRGGWANRMNLARPRKGVDKTKHDDKNATSSVCAEFFPFSASISLYVLLHPRCRHYSAPKPASRPKELFSRTSPTLPVSLCTHLHPNA